MLEEADQYSIGVDLEVEPMILPVEEAALYEPPILQDHSHHTRLDLVLLLPRALDEEHAWPEAALLPLRILDVLREHIDLLIDDCASRREKISLDFVRHHLHLVEPLLEHFDRRSLEAFPDASRLNLRSERHRLEAVGELGPRSTNFTYLLMKTVQNSIVYFTPEERKVLLHLAHFLFINRSIWKCNLRWPLLPLDVLQLVVIPQHLFFAIEGSLFLERLQPHEEKGLDLWIILRHCDLSEVVAPAVPQYKLVVSNVFDKHDMSARVIQVDVHESILLLRDLIQP